MKYFFLSLSFVFLLVAGQAKADCSWFNNANCSDVGNSKGKCGAAGNESFCSGTKPAGADIKCCCCEETLMGCCEKTNRNNNQITTEQTTIALCYDYANVNWANVRWFEDQEAKNNTCVEPIGCCRTKIELAGVSSGGYMCFDNMKRSECDFPGVFTPGAVIQAGKPCECVISKADKAEEPKPPAAIAEITTVDPYSRLTNPLRTTSVAEVIGRIIGAFLLIIGSILLLVIIYGGFLWMTALGNPAKVAKGRKTLLWGVLGAITIFLAWMLVGFILETLGVY